MPGWWGEEGLRRAGWWEANGRGNPDRDAWNGPITIRVPLHDDLESVLERLKAAMIRPRLKSGPSIYVDAVHFERPVSR